MIPYIIAAVGGYLIGDSMKKQYANGGNISNMTLEEKLENYDFEMFSKKGNDACRSLVKKVFKKIEGKNRVTEDEITEMIAEGCKKISKSFSEVYDTEPESNIQMFVNKKLKEVGYSFEVNRYDFYRE